MLATMTDIDEHVERLDKLENMVAFTHRPPGIAILVGLFVLAGVLHLFLALGATVGAFGAVFDVFAGVPVVGNLAAWLSGLSIVLLIIGILDFVVAWAIWDLQSWAWTAALTLSIVELFVIPFGLVLGIVRIVYLSMSDVRAAYREDGSGLRATLIREGTA